MLAFVKTTMKHNPGVWGNITSSEGQNRGHLRTQGEDGVDSMLELYQTILSVLDLVSRWLCYCQEMFVTIDKLFNKETLFGNNCASI